MVSRPCPKGGEFIIETVSETGPSPSAIEILFVDHGTGLKEEDKKYLFSPFFTTKLRGTGLGLAICRKIISERHKGKIYVESEEGKGDDCQSRTPSASPSRSLSGVMGPMSTPTILVVDDEPNSLFAICSF